jgi:tRNA pseudouridine13 synthase
MKLKQEPADFQVEELTCVVPGPAGPFAFYRLEKSGWTTPDALALLRRRWDVRPERLAYGGLKDRHAHTIQYLTILHGPRRSWSRPGVAFEYLGQVVDPYASTDILANRFAVTLRSLSGDEAESVRREFGVVASEGLPNYFDDQRFGSVTGQDGEFIARLLVRGRFEEALRLALTAPYEFDRAAQKEEKRVLRAEWGRWETCRGRLPPGHARSLVDYLCHHPDDFRGAVVRLRPELRGLYLSAYQSHLWNRLLARLLERLCRPEQLRPLRLRLGTVPAPHGLDAGQRRTLIDLTLPLPSARLKLADDDPHVELIRTVLAEEELELRDLQVRGVRELFFSRGERSVWCVPQAARTVVADDERHTGRRKVVLHFDLPRGSYATLIVKRITNAETAPTLPE